MISQTEKLFTYLGEDDQPRMVDVSEKAVTPRTAIAEAITILSSPLEESCQKANRVVD